MGIQDKKLSTEDFLASLPRYSDDSDIVYGHGLCPVTLAPFVRSRQIKAVIVPDFVPKHEQENNLNSDLCQDFRKACGLMANRRFSNGMLMWEKETDEFGEEISVSYHANNQSDSYSCSTVLPIPMKLQDFSNKLRNVTKYLFEDEIIEPTTWISHIPPNSGESGISPIWHIDEGIIVAHLGFSNSSIEFMVGNFTQSECSRIITRRTEDLSQDFQNRIRQLAGGSLIIFNDTLPHASSRQNSTLGQLNMAAFS